MKNKNKETIVFQIPTDIQSELIEVEVDIDAYRVDNYITNVSELTNIIDNKCTKITGSSEYDILLLNF